MARGRGTSACSACSQTQGDQALSSCFNPPCPYRVECFACSRCQVCVFEAPMLPAYTVLNFSRVPGHRGAMSAPRVGCDGYHVPGCPPVWFWKHNTSRCGGPSLHGLVAVGLYKFEPAGTNGELPSGFACTVSCPWHKTACSEAAQPRTRRDSYLESSPSQVEPCQIERDTLLSRLPRPGAVGIRRTALW